MDVDVPETFLVKHQTQLILLTNALYVSYIAQPTAIDKDVRAALEALIGGTERTVLAERFHEQMDKLRAGLTEEARGRFWADETVRKLLIFLHRLAIGRDNGTSRGRAFIAFLEEHFNKTMGGG